jgi:hypothetical protein
MKFATLFALALTVCALAVAGPVPCEVRGQDPLNPDCACGPNCPCKAAMAKQQTPEPPRAGHYVTICDGRSCHQVFVPDAAVAVGTPYPVAVGTPVTFAEPPAKFFHFQGSPTYAVSDDGTCTETRVRFMERGPIRRAISGLRRR